MSNQMLGTSTILRLNDFTLLGLVQSEDWQPNFNAQDIMEMGNEARVDTALELETSGSFEIMSHGNLAGLLARMHVARTAGAFTGYEYDAAGGSGKNGYTIEHSDMKEMQFDLVIHERTQDEFDRSMWLPRCFLTGFSGRLDANGMGSESVQWSGQDVVVLPAPYHDIRSLTATYTTSTTITLDDTAVDNTTHTLVYVYVNEARYRNASTADATKFALGASGVLTMTTSEGTVLDDTQIFKVLVYKTTGDTTFPVLDASDRGTSAKYVKAYQANIYIAPAMVGDVPTLSNASLWLRAQSVDFNVDLRVETLRQIKVNKAGTSIYCRVPTFPLSTSVNVSTYETDFEDWKRVMTKSFAGTDVYVDSLDWAPENLKASFAVVLEYFTKTGSKIQQIDFTDLRMDGAPLRNNVGGRGEMSWNLRGTAFRITGTNA